MVLLLCRFTPAFLYFFPKSSLLQNIPLFFDDVLLNGKFFLLDNFCADSEGSQTND